MLMKRENRRSMIFLEIIVLTLKRRRGKELLPFDHIWISLLALVRTDVQNAGAHATIIVIGEAVS